MPLESAEHKERSERIGFIGVGAMGLPMARRLRRAGYEVVFTSRRREAIDALTAEGAVSLPTPLVVAEQADVVMTCLPADDDLFEVFLGPEGVVEHMRPGGTIIEFSTASPMMMQRVATEASQRYIRVVDAPISGGVYGAEQGTLTIMAGCDEDLFETVRPMLEVLGKNIYHVGAPGLGKVFKIVNQLLRATSLIMVGEALSLASNAGADLDLLYDVVKSSSGNSRAWEDAVPKLRRPANSEPPGFRLELMRKDISLAAALGGDIGTPLPLTTLAAQFYTAACSRGIGKHDANEVARLVARMARAELAEEDEQR